MGWDYTHATHYTRTGAIDKKAEIDELYTWQNDTKKYEVVRSCMVGTTYYAAVKVTILSTGEAETFAAVALTHTNSRDYFNFGVKTMEESSGPCEDYCPASILSPLSSLFSPLLIQSMPIVGVIDVERTLKQRKIRTH